MLIEAIHALATGIAAVIKSLIYKYKNTLRLYRTTWQPTGSYHIPSFWRGLSVSSQSMAQNTYIAALPFDCAGFDISGIGVHVQGGISGTPVMYFGIYDENPDTGAPTNLLAETSINLTSTGTKIANISVPKSAYGNRVWLAWYLKLASSSIQLSVSSSASTAGLDFLLPTVFGINGVYPGCLISNATFSGSSMPSTFGVYGFGVSVSQVVPNLTLVVTL